MNTSETPSFLPPERLTIHPALENFPGLSDDQLAALTLSVKQRGIQTAIVVDEEHRVYDGRALLGIALALELSFVPVVVRSEEDVLGYAIESAVNRRQMTRSAIAFLLFEQHPELQAKPNAGGRPVKPAEVPQVSGEVPSFVRLAKRYMIDRDLFTTLSKAKKELNKKEWELLRLKVFVEQIALGRAYSGIRAGSVTAGVPRTEAQYFPGWEDDSAWKQSLFVSSLTTVRNAISQYPKADKWLKKRIEREVSDLWLRLPQEIRDACMEPDDV